MLCVKHIRGSLASLYEATLQRRGFLFANVASGPRDPSLAQSQGGEGRREPGLRSAALRAGCGGRCTDPPCSLGPEDSEPGSWGLTLHWTSWWRSFSLQHPSLPHPLCLVLPAEGYFLVRISGRQPFGLIDHRSSVDLRLATAGLNDSSCPSF